MLFPSMQVFRANVNNIAANSLCWVQCQRQILVHLINAQFCTSVDSSLINSALLWKIYKKTATNITWEINTHTNIQSISSPLLLMFILILVLCYHHHLSIQPFQLLYNYQIEYTNFPLLSNVLIALLQPTTLDSVSVNKYCLIQKLQYKISKSIIFMSKCNQSNEMLTRREHHHYTSHINHLYRDLLADISGTQNDQQNSCTVTSTQCRFLWKSWQIVQESWLLPTERASAVKTRMNGLSCGEKIMTIRSAVLIQYRRVTDRRTNGQNLDS